MTIQDAIIARHSVRKYADKPIETTKVATLRVEIEKLNVESGLNIQLVLDEPRCFSTGMWKYGQFSGVQHPLKPVEQFYESDGLPPKWFLIVLTLFIAIGAAGGAIMMWVDPISIIYFFFGLLEVAAAVFCMRKRTLQ